MQEESDEGTLCISAAHPYNFGDEGGYYEIVKSTTTINVYVLPRMGVSDYVVHSSGASASKWHIVAGGKPNDKRKYVVYDVLEDQIVGDAKYAHSYIDYISLGRQQLGYKNISREIDGEVDRIVWQIEGIGIGLRNNLYRVLSIHFLSADMTNKEKYMELEVLVLTSDTQSLIDLINRFLIYRRITYRLVSRTSMGNRRIKKQVKIS